MGSRLEENKRFNCRDLYRRRCLGLLYTGRYLDEIQQPLITVGGPPAVRWVSLRNHGLRTSPDYLDRTVDSNDDYTRRRVCRADKTDRLAIRLTRLSSFAHLHADQLVYRRPEFSSRGGANYSRYRNVTSTPC